MKYPLLGRRSLRVSEASLGAMTFGTEWGEGSEKPVSRRVFDAVRALAADLGKTPSRVAVNWIRQQSLASPIDLGFPRSLLEGGLRPYVFGATFDQTVDHRRGVRT